MLRLISFIFLSIFSLTSFVPVFAACSSPETQSPAEFLIGCSAGSENSVPVSTGVGKEATAKLVVQVTEVALGFGALFAIGAIVFSGIRYTTSGGDDEKLKSAKNTGIYAVVGLVLALVAFPLVDIVVAFIYSLNP